MMLNRARSEAPSSSFECRLDGPRRSPTWYLAGEIDMAALPALTAAGARLAEDVRPAVLRVDCAGVTFFDCSALRALLDVDARACARGTAVCWRHVPDCMRRVLDLTRTARSFALVD